MAEVLPQSPIDSGSTGSAVSPAPVSHRSGDGTVPQAETPSAQTSPALEQEGAAQSTPLAAGKAAVLTPASKRPHLAGTPSAMAAVVPSPALDGGTMTIRSERSFASAADHAYSEDFDELSVTAATVRTQRTLSRTAAAAGASATAAGAAGAGDRSPRLPALEDYAAQLSIASEAVGLGAGATDAETLLRSPSLEAQAARKAATSAARAGGMGAAAAGELGLTPGGGASDGDAGGFGPEGGHEDDDFDAEAEGGGRLARAHRRGRRRRRIRSQRSSGAGTGGGDGGDDDDDGSAGPEGEGEGDRSRVSVSPIRTDANADPDGGGDGGGGGGADGGRRRGGKRRGNGADSAPEAASGIPPRRTYSHGARESAAAADASAGADADAAVAACGGGGSRRAHGSFASEGEEEEMALVAAATGTDMVARNIAYVRALEEAKGAKRAAAEAEEQRVTLLRERRRQQSIRMAERHRGGSDYTSATTSQVMYQREREAEREAKEGANVEAGEADPEEAARRSKALKQRNAAYIKKLEDANRKRREVDAETEDAAAKIRDRIRELALGRREIESRVKAFTKGGAAAASGGGGGSAGDGGDADASDRRAARRAGTAGSASESKGGGVSLRRSASAGSGGLPVGSAINAARGAQGVDGEAELADDDARLAGMGGGEDGEGDDDGEDGGEGEGEEGKDKEGSARAKAFKARQREYLRQLVAKREEESKRREEEEAEVVRKRQRVTDAVMKKIGTSSNLAGGGEEEDEEAETEVKAKQVRRRVVPPAPPPTKKEPGEVLESTPKDLVMDEARWRKRQGISADQRVFIMTGWYPDVRRALLDRGWKQNPDRDGQFWDMKWVLKSTDIAHNELKEHQLVNHCSKASKVTTKSGLMHSLRQLRWFDNVDVDTFFPRCYDLSMEGDYADFVDDYKCVVAESILKAVLVNVETAHAAGAKPGAAGGSGAGEAADGGSASDGEGEGEGEVLRGSLERKGKGPTGGTVVPGGKGYVIPEPTADMQPFRSAAFVALAVDGRRLKVNKGVLRVALNVCRKRTQDYDDSLIDDHEKSTEALVRPDEWEVLRYCDVFNAGGPVEQAAAAKARRAARRAAKAAEKPAGKPATASKSAAAAGKPPRPPAAAKAGKRAGGDAKGGDDDDDEDDDEEEDEEDDDDDDDNDDDDDDDVSVGGSDDDDDDSDGTSDEESKREGGPPLLKAKKLNLGGYVAPSSESRPEAEQIANPRATMSSASAAHAAFRDVAGLSREEYLAIVELVTRMNSRASCQPGLVAARPRNTWIVKPAGKSRGRGIKCYSNLYRILHNRGGREHQEAHWVVQKYMERPLVIKRRKFDIRQWVMVTSWNPLTVWFYNDCYLRFCCVDFSLDDLSNKYIHLANNSIQKHSKNFQESEIEGNMWHSDSLIGYIKDLTGGTDLWYKSVQPQLKRIVCWSLMSAQDSVVNRKGSFELFGYDFMIDEYWRPWLIEINSSPDFSYSTKVTERVVTTGGPDAIKVVVDHHDATNGKAARSGVARAASDDPELASGPRVTASTVEMLSSHASSTADIGKVAALKRQFVTDGVETGRWELVHKAPFPVTRPLSCLAAEFVVRGQPVKLPRQSTKADASAAARQQSEGDLRRSALAQRAQARRSLAEEAAADDERAALKSKQRRSRHAASQRAVAASLSAGASAVAGAGAGAGSDNAGDGGGGGSSSDTARIGASLAADAMGAGISAAAAAAGGSPPRAGAPQAPERVVARAPMHRRQPGPPPGATVAVTPTLLTPEGGVVRLGGAGAGAGAGAAGPSLGAAVAGPESASAAGAGAGAGAGGGGGPARIAFGPRGSFSGAVAAGGIGAGSAASFGGGMGGGMGGGSGMVRAPMAPQHGSGAHHSQRHIVGGHSHAAGTPSVLASTGAMAVRGGAGGGMGGVGGGSVPSISSAASAPLGGLSLSGVGLGVGGGGGGMGMGIGGGGMGVSGVGMGMGKAGLRGVAVSGRALGPVPL